MANATPTIGTDLYRFYAADGTLLYIGISKSAIARMVQHATDKNWWGEVERITVQRVPGPRSLAEEEERLAISLERPKYNVTHNKAYGNSWNEPTDASTASLKREYEYRLTQLHKAEADQHEANDRLRERIYDAAKTINELQRRISEAQADITAGECAITGIHRQMTAARLALMDIADGYHPASS